MRILLVEDDELLGDGIRAGLIQYKHTVDWVKNGHAALQALQTELFDTVILDLNIPRVPGMEVLRTIRAKKECKNNKTPVLILTACDATNDRVTGLDSGADDYVVKPFDLDELCARLRALQRRSSARAHPMVIIGDIRLDPAAHIVFKKEQPIEIGRREFALLQMLMENIGKVVAREQITQNLYGWGDDIDSNALEVHVHNLRKKLGDDFIQTIRGVGYMIKKKEE